MATKAILLPLCIENCIITSLFLNNCLSSHLKLLLPHVANGTRLDTTGIKYFFRIFSQRNYFSGNLCGLHCALRRCHRNTLLCWAVLVNYSGPFWYFHIFSSDCNLFVRLFAVKPIKSKSDTLFYFYPDSKISLTKYIKIVIEIAL